MRFGRVMLGIVVKGAVMRGIVMRGHISVVWRAHASPRGAPPPSVTANGPKMMVHTTLGALCVVSSTVFYATPTIWTMTILSTVETLWSEKYYGEANKEKKE